MMRFFKIILKLMAAVVLMVVVFVASLFAGFGLTPEFVIKRSWIDYAVEKFTPADVKLQLGSADIRLVKEDFWRKRLVVKVSDVCADYQSPAVHVCFSEFSGEVSASYKDFKPVITYVSPLRLLDVELRADLDKLKTDDEPKEKSSFSIVDFLRKDVLPVWKFEGSRVEVKSAHVHTGEDLYSVKAYLGAAANELHLIVPEARELNNDTFKGELALVTYFPLESTGQELWRTKGMLKANAKGKIVDVRLATTSKDWKQVEYEIEAKFRKIPFLEKLNVDGTYTKEKTAGFFSLHLGKPGSEIQQLNFVKCSYNVLLEKKEASLGCGKQQVVVALKERPIFKNSPDLFILKPTFELNLTDVDFKKGVKAKADLHIALEHMSFVEADFKALAHIDATRKNDLRWDVETHLKAGISEFQKLVKFLVETPYAAPAPVNVMKGQITFKLDGKMNQDDGRFPFELRPDLTSDNQRILLGFKGEADLKALKAGGFRTKLTMDSSIEDLRLSVPRLELAALPQLVPDQRFIIAKNGISDLKKAVVKPPEKKSRSKSAGSVKSALAGNGSSNVTGKVDSGMTRSGDELAQPSPPDANSNASDPESKTNFLYDVKISTTHVGAIQVATNLTKGPIPIGVSVEVDNSKDLVQGAVDIGQVGIELFKRQALIQQVNLQLMADGTKPLKARVLVKYLDYDIYANISGTVSAPILHLESDPPLEQNDIVSVLLFGRTSDELDENEQSSVADFNTAAADKAVGLTSLFLLSGTPIESLGYNAETGTLSAKVGLGKGTSLEVGGSDQSLSQVGVRRRLSRRWVLSSYVEKDPVTNNNAVVAFLEWVRLY